MAEPSRSPPHVTESPSPSPWHAAGLRPSRPAANPFPEELAPEENASRPTSRSSSRKFARDVASRVGGGGGAPRRRKPYFCALAFIACCAMFLAEIGENGWAFQPLTCPSMCDGAPCYDDGTACESNLLIGPTLAVMYRLGAKVPSRRLGAHLGACLDCVPAIPRRMTTRFFTRASGGA